MNERRNIAEYMSKEEIGAYFLGVKYTAISMSVDDEDGERVVIFQGCKTPLKGFLEGIELGRKSALKDLERREHGL